MTMSKFTFQPAVRPSLNVARLIQSLSDSSGHLHVSTLNGVFHMRTM